MSFIPDFSQFIVFHFCNCFKVVIAIIFKVGQVLGKFDRIEPRVLGLVGGWVGRWW